MRIINVRKVEDCFDGSSVFSYESDVAWDERALDRLRRLGELEYFPHFPRPFFRLIGAGGMQVKGVLGDTTCRVILPRRDRDVIRDRLECALTAACGLTDANAVPQGG